MKNKDFLEIFDGIDEKFIDEAKNGPEQAIYAVETQPLKHSSKKYIFINVLKAAACAAAVCAVTVPAIILSGSGSVGMTENNEGLTENSVYEKPSALTGENAYTTGTSTDNPDTAADEPTVTNQPVNDPRNEIAPGIRTNGTLVCEQNGHHRGIVLYDNGSKRDDFVRYINAFADDLGDGIKTYVMIAPTSGEYYTPKNFEEYNASQSDDISYIAGGLSDKVTSVDCVSTLREHIDEEIYLRTDHHWQPLGAYYAAGEFAKTANVPFPELNTYEKRDIDEYVGTLYSVVTQDADLLNDPETFTYYIPANSFECCYYDQKYNFDRKDSYFLEMPVAYSYEMFMGGDNKIVKIETDVKNGRKLAVLKDCYGNAEIPFLTNGFEEIYVCDIRYFDLNAVEFIKQQGITDVLFTMCTFSATGENCNYIETIRTNPLSSDTAKPEPNITSNTQTTDYTDYTDHAVTFPAADNGSFTLSIELPQSWNLAASEGENPQNGSSDFSVTLETNGKAIGTIDYDVYDPSGIDETQDNAYRMIYNQIMLGSMASWDCDYTPIEGNHGCSAATCRIMTRDTDPSEYPIGILAHDSHLGSYVKICLYDCNLSKSVVDHIAGSIRLAGADNISVSTVVLTPKDTDLIAECVINSEFLDHAHSQGHGSCVHHGLTIVVDNNNAQTILPAEYGENVYALCGGTVVCTEDEGDCGRHVSVMLDDGTYITYGHLSEMNVKVGDTVVKNQLLGCAGSTGTITDCGVGYYHHTEAHHHGSAVTTANNNSHHGSSHHSDNHH